MNLSLRGQNMWNISQLRDFTNTMIQVIVTLGGISFALALFTFQTYTQRAEQLREEAKQLSPGEYVARYFQLLGYWIALILTTLSALVLLLGPLGVIVLYYNGSVDPNHAVLSLIVTYSVGMLLLIAPLRLFLVGRPKVEEMEEKGGG